MTVVAFAVGYLLGSIPFPYLIGALHGVDLRRTGSGNVGTENVATTVGMPWAVAPTKPVTTGITFLLDVGKALAVLLPTAGAAEPIRVAAALGVIVGHDWPVWLGFVGGRGELVTLVGGVMLAPKGTAVVLGVLGVGLFWRPRGGGGRTHLAEAWFVGAVAYPFLAWVLDGSAAGWFAVGASLLALGRRLQGSPLLRRRGSWRNRVLHDRDTP